jgi:hypothetical protein
VKFSSSCPATHESYLVIDNGAQLIRPPLFGKVYVWLDPGTHLIDVSHPWCHFFPVHLKLDSDGTFDAVSNSSVIQEFPIIIRHYQKPEITFMGIVTSGQWMLPVFLLPVGIHYLRKYLYPDPDDPASPTERQAGEHIKQE